MSPPDVSPQAGSEQGASATTPVGGIPPGRYLASLAERVQHGDATITRVVTPVRRLTSDELGTVRDDLALMRRFSTDSAVADAVRAIQQLDRTVNSAVEAWRPEDQQPPVAIAAALASISRRVGELATRALQAADEPVEDDTRAMTAGEVEYVFPGRGEPVEARYLERHVSVAEVTASLTAQLLTTEMRAILEHEQGVRAAALRLRILVAPVLDGMPILCDVSNDGLPRASELEHLDLTPIANCMNNLAVAHNHLVEATPVTEVSEKPASARKALEPEPPESGEADAPPAPAEIMDVGVIDLALMAQGVMDSTASLRDAWSEALTAAAQSPNDPDFDVLTQTFGLFIMRLTRQVESEVLRPAGISVHLPGFPPPIQALVNSLRGNETDQHTLNGTLAMLAALQGWSEAISSLREPTLVAASGGRERFWNDGAFHSILLHIDTLQQTLLAQVDAAETLANERLAPGFKGTSKPDGALQFTFNVSARAPHEHYATLAHQSYRLGDYSASLFHTRNYLIDVARRVAPLSTLVRSHSTLTDEEASAYESLADMIEVYILEAKYDVARLVNLTTAALRLLDLLRRAVGEGAVNHDAE